MVKLIILYLKRPYILIGSNKSKVVLIDSITLQKINEFTVKGPV
jgi:hypothetical protein